MTLARPHYTSVVRTLIHLYESGALTNVAAISVEPDYGFYARIAYHNGAVRYISGASTDVNGSGAGHIATHKDSAKHFIRQLGYQTPRGRAFVTPRRMEEIAAYLNMYGLEERYTFEAVPAYVREVVGLPCFIKPNDGSRGQDVYRCTSLSEVEDVLRLMATRPYELIMVEEAVSLPEYRVLVFEGAVWACYSKEPLAVWGDGHSTIGDLLAKAQRDLEAAGRKIDLSAVQPQIEGRLRKDGLSLMSVPGEGDYLRLLDMANLSVGGSTHDYTDAIHPHWADLCIRLSRDMGLTLAGIDFMCEDIRQGEGAYTVIEINSAPSLQNYASIAAEQAARARALYLRIFNTPPGGSG